MRDPRLDDARRKYGEELETLGAFKNNIEVTLKFALAERSIEGVVSGRVKTLDSLLKKLLRKPNHTYDSLSDKVGVRVISNEARKACDVIRERFICLAEDDKAAALGPDRLGYPGTHFDIENRPDDEPGAEFRARGLKAEIQVRTYAQHAWCDVSHRFDYKQDAQEQVPQKLKRRLMLTVGLLEIADINLTEVSREINALPAFQLNKTLDSLEALYFRLSSRPPDRELSLSTLSVLVRLYVGGAEELFTRVSRLIETKKDVLRHVFERNERMQEPRAALFFQPETLVVYDLLETDKDALLDAWITVLPEEELFRLATEFGYAYGHVEY